MAVNEFTYVPLMGIKQDRLKGSDRIRQRAVSIHGRQFEAFKFRTKDVNGDKILASFPDLHKESALNHKPKNNPRITHLGIFLGKTCLDQLHHLINTLQVNRPLGNPHTLTSEEVGKYTRGASLPRGIVFVIGPAGALCSSCPKSFLR